MQYRQNLVLTMDKGQQIDGCRLRLPSLFELVDEDYRDIAILP
jgi:hypothetical protein